LSIESGQAPSRVDAALRSSIIEMAEQVSLNMVGQLRDKAAILGIGETAYTKRGRAGRSEMALACEAIKRAVADAGLGLDEVDGLCAYNSDRCTILEVAEQLGLRLRFANLYPGGGNSATGVVQNAAMAVATETASVVVCYRSISQGQVRYGQARSGYGAHAGALQDYASSWQAFTAPFGLMTPAQMYALDTRRHMHLYGTTSEQMGLVAVNSYANAQRNPRAVMYGRPLTLEEHQASRMIADPYRLFDCCQESDGACAVVVTSRDRAEAGSKPVVLVAGAAQGMARGDGVHRAARLEELWASAGMVEVARELYAAAGIGPQDVDVLQVYENFTGQVIMAMEDFGICRRGEGGRYVEAGEIFWPDGRTPLNTSGGNLAEAYIHGLSLVLEGVRQMRGESTSQVEGAGHCLVVSGPGAPPSSALILRRAG
jgi:acetyl-CoA acetyltransferase